MCITKRIFVLVVSPIPHWGVVLPTSIEQMLKIEFTFIMSPLCFLLTAFSSKSELIQAFIDIIQSMHFVLNHSYISNAWNLLVHWKLVKIRILHRDLSLNNLSLWPVVPDMPSADDVSILPTSSPHCSTISQFQEWRGIIIDFNYAIWIKPSLNAAACEPCKRDRTVSQLQISQSTLLPSTYQGTIPFMSVELLDPPPQTEVTNSFQHNLESLFYVFVWICSMYDAPGVLLQTCLEWC
jgi:Fungal protein kinase